MLLSVIAFSCKKEKKAEDMTTDEVVVEEVAVEEATEEAVEESVEETAAAEKEISVVYPKDAELAKETSRTIKRFVADHPDLKKYFNNAYGFAVFPVITKGGLGIGGAAGKGLVFENKVVTGMSKMTQATIGAQAGGQQYMEAIFFKDKKALENFTGGKVKWSGQVSAIALEAGTSIDMKYNDGVAIYTKGKGGLMAEASVGGQKFKYHPGI